MPILSIFFGIIVPACGMTIHPPPHIHVEYQGFGWWILWTGEISEGRLPNKAAAIVKEWCLAIRLSCCANWEHAQPSPWSARSGSG
jgi:hypothetical protein